MFDANVFYGFMFLILYMLPTLNAHSRKHLNTVPIACINLFFGWTVVGWIICVAWSFSSHVEKPAPKTKTVMA